jgi:hypothetical protein
LREGEAVETTPGVTRRRFLARLGVLGAGLAVHGTGVLEALPARAASASRLASDALALLERDTFRGLVAWVVPGPDPYSRAQRHHSPTPGGVAARTDRFLIDGLDRLLPLPDEMLAPAIRALATGTSDSLDVSVPVLGGAQIARLDDALQTALANDETVPASLLVAMLLNHLATQVSPSSIVGPFPASPYANLRFADKTEAFRRLEEDHARVAARIDGRMSEPNRRSLSGLLRLLGSALPTFTAFGTYSEYHAFDRRARTARRRPIGWELSSFSPGRARPADGWPELKGYHRGVR